MCLWVIRETSQCGPDILGDESECAACRSFKINKVSIWFSRFSSRLKLTPSQTRTQSKRLAKSPQSLRLEVNMCGGFQGRLTHTPRGTHVWQIRPTIMGNVCGVPDRLHVTWLDSHTTSYAPVAMAMPGGQSPPPFKTVDPHPPTFIRRHISDPHFSLPPPPQKSLPQKCNEVESHSIAYILWI